MAPPGKGWKGAEMEGLLEKTLPGGALPSYRKIPDPGAKNQPPKKVLIRFVLIRPDLERPGLHIKA